MIEINGVQYRNLQEQVAENARKNASQDEDIENIWTYFTKVCTNRQIATGLIIDPLTNINGKSLTSYTTESTTIGGYPCLIVKTAGGGLLNNDAAGDYLEALFGCRFAPEYDFDHPRYHVLIDSSGYIYKPQWDIDYGLVLYYVPSPFQAKLTAGSGISINSSNVISCTASGGTQLYKHSLWFEDQDVNYYASVRFISTSANPITGVYQLMTGVQNQTILNLVFESGSAANGMSILGARDQGAGIYEFLGYNYIMTDYESTPVFTNEQIDTENYYFPTSNFHDTITAL